MIVFTRPILIFGTAAILLGLGADGLFFFAASLSKGSVAVFARPAGWVLFYALIWTAAFAIGILVARRYGMFPFGH
jgi:hypothetical protein